MKIIGKLLIASVLAAGAAGCADYYGSEYGYGSNPAYDYGRGYDYYRDGGYDRGWDRGVIHRDGRRYCLMDNGRYAYCGRDYE
jgi:hypothetical protein